MHEFASVLPAIALWALAGAALSAVYLRLVARSVAAIADDGAWGAAASWFALRLALAAVSLGLAAAQGILPALAMLAGFVMLRSVVLARARRA